MCVRVRERKRKCVCACVWSAHTGSDKKCAVWGIHRDGQKTDFIALKGDKDLEVERRHTHTE